MVVRIKRTTFTLLLKSVLVELIKNVNNKLNLFLLQVFQIGFDMVFFMFLSYFGGLKSFFDIYQ